MKNTSRENFQESIQKAESFVGKVSLLILLASFAVLVGSVAI